MTIGSAVGGRLIYAKEPTQNTREVPDHHLEFLQESMQLDEARIIPRGLAGGRRVAKGFAVGNRQVGGSISLEVVPESIGELLELCFGTSNTTGAGPYTHTMSPGPIATGTFQLITPSTDGTERVREYTGCMVQSWTLSCDATGDGAMLELQVELVGYNETTNQSAVAASYPTISARWSSVQASLTVAGAAYCVNSWTLSGANNVDVDHKACAANAGKPDIRESGAREYTGTLVADFDDLTQYGRYTGATQSALVITAADDGTSSLVITTNVIYTGTTPNMSGPEVVKQESPFMCLSATSDAAAITAVLINGDSAP